MNLSFRVSHLSCMLFFASVQIGHVDAGKSSLMGRILHLLGRVSRKDMHKNERESKQQVSHKAAKLSFLRCMFALK